MISEVEANAEKSTIGSMLEVHQIGLLKNGRILHHDTIAIILEV